MARAPAKIRLRPLAICPIINVTMTVALNTAAIQRLNHRHEGVMRWLLANPDKSLTQCAADLGYTITWVSILVRSQAFQSELRERQHQLYGEVAFDIKDKLVAAAHMALDKIVETLPVATPDYALDVAKETLKSLGYSSPRPTQVNISQTNNTVNMGNVSADELARAREMMLSKRAAQAPMPLLPQPEEPKPEQPGGNSPTTTP